ncbi:spike base protein, RCAP_Rcc01079 family [Roseinatronobacter monicus]|uniref:spike base protein, RCAP_Rcc01079 family n=1 Tax=Roseinatronobacter monicus TaxID=393481 RepID=UPI003F3D1242
MFDPLANRTLSPAGPATDIIPVTPDDAADLPVMAMSVFVETGGALCFVTRRGETRTVMLDDQTLLPVVVRRVLATGTTATGVHALVVI